MDFFVVVLFCYSGAFMNQYIELLKNVLNNGNVQTNRTGEVAYSLPGQVMRFDLEKGFPAVTIKKLPFKSAVGELCGFLRGYSNAEDFRNLNCKVWDQNANENSNWLNKHKSNYSLF